ncbi:caspase family protein [Streptomyces sp. CA-249302]|uniref:caspase family protein n=1 Tax=Streptomyces sp. CA-249302 TaxID=3240058 RepID=UPI003D8B3CF2
MRLPDPRRSYAVLIGASTYRSDAVADLPAVRNNLYYLAAVLTHPGLGGLPVERCVVVPDPTDVRAVYRTLRSCASAAEDTLLVYFAGHGQTGPRDELFLVLADTDPSELRFSALPFDVIREVIADSPAADRVVILDCCFSGRAVQDMGSGTETPLGQVGIEGTYVLTSAPVNTVAPAPVGATYTSFTGKLLAFLTGGVPGGPALLTFGEIYRRLLRTATAKGLPVPGQRGTGTVDMPGLTRNPAATEPGAPAPAAGAAEGRATGSVLSGTWPSLKVRRRLGIPLMLLGVTLPVLAWSTPTPTRSLVAVPIVGAVLCAAGVTLRKRPYRTLAIAAYVL